MTRQPLIAILIGLLLCFCLLAKQAMQSYDSFDNLLDQSVAQEVVVESLDANDLVDVADDFLVVPFLFLAICLMLLATPSLISRYAQPIIRSPHRPPSI